MPATGRIHRVIRVFSLVRLLLTVAAVAPFVVNVCSAQFGGAGGNLGGGNQFGGGGGGGGGQIGGILIDADGVLALVDPVPRHPRLEQAARDAFVAEQLNGDLATSTDRHCVSLVRLERKCARRLDSAMAIDESIQYLAGLQRIDYLFVDPDGGDLVIAGPAEGFAPDAAGRMAGVVSGRPPLRLDDLVVAIQAAASGVRAIGCSIDPEPARLAQMQEFVRHNSAETSPAGAARRYEQMAEILGRQQISVFGVPADSHFALTLVEADFRMKRISLGVERSGVRGLASYLSLLTPGGNSIQRWWFTPKYDAIVATGDRTAFQFAGRRVQLHAQEEITDADGQRFDAPVTRPSVHNFAKMFTAKYPELAGRSPLFAELQNLFDLAIVAALIHEEGLGRKAGWRPRAFLQADARLVPGYAAARQVPSTSTFRKARRGLILGLVGGVTIDPRQVLRQIETLGDDARLSGVRRAALQIASGDGESWWWD